ncbi:MAG: hypothetical protein ACRCX2_38985 [Paraclostridium sp.]
MKKYEDVLVAIKTLDSAILECKSLLKLHNDKQIYMTEKYDEVVSGVVDSGEEYRCKLVKLAKYLFNESIKSPTE